MNKTWIAVLGGAILISMVGLGIQHISANPDDAQFTSTEIRTMMEEKYPGKVTELELERENGQLVYEVEIEGPNGEYEVKVDASTAEIVKLEEKTKKTSLDGRDDRQAKTKNDQQASDNEGKKSKNKPSEKSAKNTRISIDEAMEIALTKFPGVIDDVELERDDGLLYYEVEIETENGEVEVEVDAYTGEIVMISWDD